MVWIEEIMDAKQYRQAIRDARNYYGTTGNAEARDGLLRKIARWTQILRRIEGKKKYEAL
jgi:hypothetical protein